MHIFFADRRRLFCGDLRLHLISPNLRETFFNGFNLVNGIFATDGQQKTYAKLFMEHLNHALPEMQAWTNV